MMCSLLCVLLLTAPWRAAWAVATPQDDLRFGVVANDVAAVQHRAPSAVKPAQGRLLVAQRSVSDPRFAETVILLIAYSDEGAMGVIINRPTEIRLASALPKMKELHDRPERVFVGGPVSPGAMLLLIRAGTKPDGAQPVFENVYVSGSLDTLRKAVGQRNKSNRLRAYAGYAGWGPGQLDNEIKRGDWLLGPADAAIVFDMPSGEVWPKLVERFAVEWARALQVPSSASTSASGGGLGWRPGHMQVALLSAPPP